MPISSIWNHAVFSHYQAQIQIEETAIPISSIWNHPVLTVIWGMKATIQDHFQNRRYCLGEPLINEYLLFEMASASVKSSGSFQIEDSPPISPDNIFDLIVPQYRDILNTHTTWT